MAEYIDREALNMEILELTVVDPTVAQYADAVLLCLKDAPATDVAPVVHGRWVNINREIEHMCKCSACDYRVSGFWRRTPYCPNCGARMDGEGDHAAD